jgi:uncharacterized integral membrane protein
MSPAAQVDTDVSSAQAEPALDHGETEHNIRERLNIESRPDRFRRKAHRARLNGYAIGSVALVAILIALGASNTAKVKINWLVGDSHVSLVWLVLVVAILGWLLGLIASARFRWLTRAPTPGTQGRSWLGRRRS